MVTNSVDAKQACRENGKYDLVILNYNLLHELKAGGKLYVDLVDNFPDLAIYIIGWSTDFDNIDKWNEVIDEVKREQISKINIARIPPLSWCLRKPVDTEELEELLIKNHNFLHLHLAARMKQILAETPVLTSEIQIIPIVSAEITAEAQKKNLLR